MFDKAILVNKLVNTLEKNEFEVFVTNGCFDIAARRENLLLIKTLLNIDGLNGEHALSLRAISYFISAYPFVVSTKNNREMLSNDTVYKRFDLPVMTPKSFEEMLTDDEIVVDQAAKGRHTQEINTFELKERREELDYTFEELAKQIGISKKAMYEIENRRVNPTKTTVKKLEMILSTELAIPYEMSHAEPTYLTPKSEFQNNVSKEFSRIGIDNSAVYSAPFEIIGKEKFPIITALSTSTKILKKESVHMKGLSKTFDSKAVFVTKTKQEERIEGVPIVHESELAELESTNELTKIIEEA